MRADPEIKMLGLEVLNKNLGIVEAERFVALIQRERLDYTKWRQDLFNDMWPRNKQKSNGISKEIGE